MSQGSGNDTGAPPTDGLVHVSVPEKPKYTKRKPEALGGMQVPSNAGMATIVGGEGLTPAGPSSGSETGDALAGLVDQQQEPNTGGVGVAKAEIDSYSPTHFQGGILSPVYTGGQEVVYDPANVPLPQAAKRLAVDAALRDTPVMQPPQASQPLIE